MIRMAAVDLDRTLLRADASVSAYTHKVLAQWRASGRKLVIASARPMRTLRGYIDQLQADGAAIGNGALVWTKAFERQIPIAHDAAERFLQSVFEEFPDSTVSVEIDDTLYANFEITEWSPTILPDLTQLPPGNVRKILLTYVDEGHLESIRRKLQDGMRLSVAHQKLIQIQHGEADKWNALQILAGHWGIAADEIACFGDDWDDLEMIKNAGWGVAVENGIEEVKSAADEIAPSNEADGPAQVLLRIMAEERR